jgi:hypothetical protein
MRLIDADEFREIILTYGKAGCGALPIEKISELIDGQSTAYDMDKVVEKLQTELNSANDEKERCYRENQLQLDVAKGYAYGVWVSLEIVKSGVID